MIEAILYMHRKLAFSHNDIKPDNFVFRDDLTLAVIDFGHTSAARRPKWNYAGTDCYNPPELLRIGQGS